MSLAERSFRGLAYGRESFWQKIIQSLARLQALAVNLGLRAQGVIRHGFKFRLQSVDLIDQGAEFLQFPVIFCAENLLGYAEHETS